MSRMRSRAIPEERTITGQGADTPKAPRPHHSPALVLAFARIVGSLTTSPSASAGVGHGRDWRRGVTQAANPRQYCFMAPRSHGFAPQYACLMERADWERISRDFGITNWVITEEASEFGWPSGTTGILEPVMCAG